MTSNSQRQQKIASTIASLVLLAAFGYLALMVAHPFLQAFSSRNWQHTEAVIVKSNVIQDCPNEHSYTNSLTYLYSIQGRQFEGHREHFGISFCGHKEDAQERADVYIPGRAIQIRYDAEHPEESVVDTSTVEDGSYLLAAFFACVLVALAGKAIPSLYRSE